MTVYSHQRVLWRVAMLDLLDYEESGDDSGSSTPWGATSQATAAMLAGHLPPGERKSDWWPRMRAVFARAGGGDRHKAREAMMAWLRDRAIVRVARACSAAFSAPFTIPEPAMRRLLNGDGPESLRAASLIHTPIAYYATWHKPGAKAPAPGNATTRRLSGDDAERRVGLERALAAQQAADAAAKEARWKTVHEDVTRVRDHVVLPRAATQPYGAVRPPK